MATVDELTPRLSYKASIPRPLGFPSRRRHPFFLLLLLLLLQEAETRELPAHSHGFAAAIAILHRLLRSGSTRLRRILCLLQGQEPGGSKGAAIFFLYFVCFLCVAKSRAWRPPLLPSSSDRNRVGFRARPRRLQFVSLAIAVS